MQPLLAPLALPLLSLAVPSPAEPCPAVSPVDPAPALDAALLRAVPSDSMLFFGLWDLDGLRERGERSAWYRFYRDEQVQTFVRAVGDGLEKAMERSGEGSELPFKLSDVGKALHGSVASFVQVSVPEESVVAGCLMAPGEHRPGVEELFDGLLGLAEEELETSTETYGEAELVRMDAQDGDAHIIFADLPNLLGVVVSNEADVGIGAVHGILDRFTGEDPAEGLAGSAALTQARASAKGRRDFEMLLNAEPMIEAILAEQRPGEEELGIFRRIGVTELRWVYGSFGLGTGEVFDSTVSVYVPPRTYLADLMRLLGPAPLEMLKQMPASAKQVSATRFDVHGLFKLVMRAVREQNEEAYNEANGMIQMMGAMNGVDIEQDVLAQITGDFGSFGVPHAGDMDLASMALGVTPGTALLIGLRDPEEFELFLDDVLTNFQLDQMIESTEFMGADVRKFEADGAAVYFTFTDSALVYAGSPEPIHGVLRVAGREDVPTAHDDATLRKLAASRPGVASFSLMETSALVSMYLEIFSSLSELMGMYGMDADENPFTYLPWPDAAIAEKYFEGRIVSTLESVGDTVRAHMWSQ